MSKPVYIVMAGKKQHGKDTAADIIETALFAESNIKSATKIYRTSFAEPLKTLCSDVFGISQDDMATDQGKQKLTDIKWEDLDRACRVQDGYMHNGGYMTIREVLQYFGSNICRNRFYNNIWAYGPFKRSELNAADITIITDCRFKNELAASRSNDAIVLYVDRKPSPTGKDEHISEKDLDDVTFASNEIVYNHGTLPEFIKKIRQVHREIIIPKIKKQRPDLWI